VTATVHASCVAIEGRAVLIAGGSGKGKSDLALRLIDRGARLVSDDYTVIHAEAGRLYASAPPAIAGRIEIRHVGLVEMERTEAAPVCLHVDLDSAPERLPEPCRIALEGVELPSLALAALEASAPIKLEQALRLHGIPFP
jgi:serine kinase of HPr protein (carbohydrate metabolism regulator)